MKQSAKVLCIIGLVIGIVWSAVGFFGVWFGGAVVATAEHMTQGATQADAVMDTTTDIMLKLLGSFMVVIIGGVLGIIGSSSKSSKVKLLVFGFLTVLTGFLLFPLSNYVSSVIYVIAGLLLFLSGIITKASKTDSQKGGKQLLFVTVIIILFLVVVMVFSFPKDNSVVVQNTDNVLAPQEDTLLLEEFEAEDSVEPTESVESDNFGMWEIGYFVDDFGEPTEKGYIRPKSMILGTFSNDFTQDSELGVDFIISSSESVDIRFYEYGNSLKKTNSNISYKVQVKEQGGDITTLSAYHNYDRLRFTPSESTKLYNILKLGGVIKFNIVGSYSFNNKSGEYKFIVENATGFEKIASKLLENKLVEEESKWNLSKDFSLFIDRFITDRSFQVTHIKFPLRLIESKANWEFLDSNNIFEGIKKTQSLVYRGSFYKESDDKYRYTLYSMFPSENDYYEDGGELVLGLDFSKNDGEWQVVDIFYGGE